MQATLAGDERATRPRSDADTERMARRLPFIYGAIHALVDASSVMVIFAALLVHRLDLYSSFYLIVSYDILAFGSQVFLGALTDKLRSPRAAALGGLGLTALATMTLPFEPISAMVLAGLGNAAFHVGAGSIALRIVPDRAWAPGVFVGPGALGLAFGIWIGKSGSAVAWPFALALLVSFVVTLLLPDPPHPHNLAVDPDSSRPSLRLPRLTLPTVPFPKIVVGLLLLSIVIRSTVGFAGGHQMPKSVAVLFGLGTAAFLGKSLGGIIADRVGWLESSVGALLLSAPLIAFGGTNAAVIILGMFLFQMTMPVTLTAVALAHPGRPGFAFGMTCLALILGALPTFYPFIRPYYGSGTFFGAIALSATVVYVALRLMGDANPVRGLLSRPRPDPTREQP